MSHIRPEQKFSLGKVYKAPKKVVDCGKIILLGVEWGPDFPHHQKSVAHGNQLTWVYLVRDDLPWDPIRDRHTFYVGEEELTKWNT